MTYRMTYLRIQCYGLDPLSPDNACLTAFKAESRRLFQDLGWTVHEGKDGVSDTVTKGVQDLYLHPNNFSGVLNEADIPMLQEQLSGARTFRCYAVDCYEEYVDMSDEEYRAVLGSKRDEIIAFILKQCQTKRANLYIIDPVTDHIAEHFAICRICDKDRRNRVGRRFVSELMDQLLQEGRLVAAETTYGAGIRTTTVKELQTCSRSEEQVDGQMTF